MVPATSSRTSASRCRTCAAFWPWPTPEPNTNGSQFFIVLSNNTGLPPNYTIFGRVTRGMDAVDRITHVKLGPGSDGANSKPLTRVYMKTVAHQGS